VELENQHSRNFTGDSSPHQFSKTDSLTNRTTKLNIFSPGYGFSEKEVTTILQRIIETQKTLILSNQPQTHQKFNNCLRKEMGSSQSRNFNDHRPSQRVPQLHQGDIDRAC
jgi:hypothetical protein